MHRTFYHSFTLALLVALAASCSQEKFVEPEARTESANARTAATTLYYQQYTNLPEPIGTLAGNAQDLSYKIPYVLGKSQVTGGHPIYYYAPITSTGTVSPTAGKWQLSPGPNGGGAIKFNVAPYSGPNGTLFAITDQNQLWSNNNSGSGWYNTAISASDIAISGTGVVYYLDNTNVRGGRRIYRLTPQMGSSGTPQGSAPYANLTPQEVIPGSAATSLAVDEYGRLWAVNSLNQIFCNSSPQTGGSFYPVAGGATTIACDGYGTVAITGNRFINHGYEIYVRDVTTPLDTYGWELQQGDATQVSSSSANSNGYYLLNDLGEVFLATH